MLVGMQAGGAYLGRLGALEDVAAHQALPPDGLFPLPHGAVVDALLERQEAVSVVPLHLGDGAEAGGDVGEALLFGNVGGPGVHLHALVQLLGGGDGQVLRGRRQPARVDSHGALGTDGSLGEVLQEDLAVVELVGGRLGEDVGHLEVLFLLGRLGIVGVARHGR